MSGPINNAAPLAQTLDEPALRALFAQAPERLEVPKDVRSIFRARMRRLGGERRSTLIGASAGLVVLGFLLLMTGTTGAGIGLLGVLLIGVVLVALVVVMIVQYSRSSKDFFVSYAAARGLEHDDDNPRIECAVPLFERGDKRRWQHVMRGTIAGSDAHLGHYQWTTVLTNSEGNRTEIDHDFTVLSFQLPPKVAARFSGVYLGPRQLGLGSLQDKLAHQRKVKLESAEFAKRYNLRVRDDQDDIALFELFSPPFLHLLATDLEVYWEQVGPDLVIWQQGHEHECADLDRLCLHGASVLRRYLQEDR